MRQVSRTVILAGLTVADISAAMAVVPGRPKHSVFPTRWEGRCGACIAIQSGSFRDGALKNAGLAGRPPPAVAWLTTEDLLPRQSHDPRIHAIT